MQKTRSHLCGKMSSSSITTNTTSTSRRDHEDETEWEMRPGGMLVQKRNEKDGVPALLNVRLRVLYGVLRYRFSVNSQAMFGRPCCGSNFLRVVCQGKIHKSNESHHLQSHNSLLRPRLWTLCFELNSAVVHYNRSKFSAEYFANYMFLKLAFISLYILYIILISKVWENHSSNCSSAQVSLIKKHHNVFILRSKPNLYPQHSTPFGRKITCCFQYHCTNQWKINPLHLSAMVCSIWSTPYWLRSTWLCWRYTLVSCLLWNHHWQNKQDLLGPTG